MEQLAYCYNNIGEYTHAEGGQIDPLETELQGETVWLLPANSTTVQPPPAPEGHVNVWQQGAWVATPDHRGKQGFLPDGTPCTVEELGPLPEGWQEHPPAPSMEEATLARIKAIDAAITTLELQALRPLLAIEMGLAEQPDLEKKAELLEAIIALRCERQNLEASLWTE